MTTRLAVLPAALAAALALAGCGASEVHAEIPVPSGSTAELAGTWDFTMPRGASTCAGVMTIDGATGRGTFNGCSGMYTGTVAGAVDTQGKVLVVFQPSGLQVFWIRGTLWYGNEIDGFVYGPDWNGQGVFQATRQ